MRPGALVRPEKQLPGAAAYSIIAVVSAAGNYPGTLREDRDFYARLALACGMGMIPMA